jgi:cytochrome P450
MVRAMDEIAQPQTAPDHAARASDYYAGASLIDIDLYASGKAHDAFDAVRVHAPVAWVDEPPPVRRGAQDQLAPFSPGLWAVTSHELVDFVSRNPESFSSALGGSQLFTAHPDQLLMLRLLLLNVDPPEQTRLRRILAPAFSPRSVNLLMASIERNAAEIAESLAGSGEVDLVTACTAELPIRTIADMLGVPEADRHLVREWSDALIGFENAESMGMAVETAMVFANLLEYGKQVLRDRRATPRDDLMTNLATAEVDGEQLTEDEFGLFYLLLVIAGNETTRNSLSGAVIALQEQGKWGELAADPDLLATATDECIRFVSPVNQFRRTATRDVEIGGQHVRAGDKVVLFYSAANHDPAVFQAPHSLDLTRDPNPHLAFGFGPHFCLGSRLAKLQFSTMMRELVTRYPDLQLAGTPQRLRSNFINGVLELPVSVGSPAR